MTGLGFGGWKRPLACFAGAFFAGWFCRLARASVGGAGGFVGTATAVAFEFLFVADAVVAGCVHPGLDDVAALGTDVAGGVGHGCSFSKQGDDVDADVPG